jgi:hypothetical protein
MVDQHSSTATNRTTDVVCFGRKSQFPSFKEDMVGAESYSSGLSQHATGNLSFLTMEQSNGVLQQGWMSKLGGVMRNWKKRFFVMHLDRMVRDRSRQHSLFFVPFRHAHHFG